MDPGQFVMLEIPDRIRPFLRRAYSVADADRERGEVEFLVKTIGVGNDGLERSAPARESAFWVPSETPSLSPASTRRPSGHRGGWNRRRSVSSPLSSAGRRPASPETSFSAGGPASELEVIRRFEPVVNGEIHLATDDGSRGTRGYVTDLFARVARETPYARVFACGPMPMFAALASIVSRLAVPAEFSTEATMGCGFGACLACVIPGTDQPYLVSCQEGPILEPERVRW